MTLSFGVDPKQKTLMFTNESPFHLNDCQDIDANLPLEKQEYVVLFTIIINVDFYPSANWRVIIT